MLCYVIIFSAHLMMALKVQAQCESPVVGENLNMTEISDQQTFPEGYTVKFKCSTGYIPARTSASRSITCIGNQWSKLQLQCKKKSCGNPGEILHGKYLFPEGFRYGATIMAQCNEGYQLIGDSVRNCRETGWDKTHPVCEVVKCINPPSVPDGVFEPEEEVYNYGGGVYYSCKRGLDLFGPSKLTCSNDGTFQPAPPRCLFVTCERPEILNAVRIEGKSPPYKYSNFVRYQCNEGYKMEGSDFLICKEDGWDPPPPQCTIVTCLPPTLIHNGQFNPQKELYEYGNSVKFTCNKGFKLKGSASSSCTEHGIFKPSPPQCEVVTCERPKILNAVRIEGKWPPYKYRDVVRYRCNKGYKMEGSDRIICKEDGWDPPPPQCTIVTCLPPPLIQNGQFKPQEELYKYGNRVTFTCNEGFKLKGSASVLCTKDGIFQPSPQCQAQCVRPIIGENRILAETSRQDNFPDGSTLTYKCSTGYVPEQPGSSNSITCKGNQWTELQLQCKLKSCESPGEIPHGKYLTPDGILFGATATAQCDEGYTLVGERTRNCRDDGWDGRDPVCEHQR